MVFSGDTGLAMNSLIQQVFIVIDDGPDTVPGGVKINRQKTPPAWSSIPVDKTINNCAIHRICERGMCAVDKNKVQRGNHKGWSSVSVGQGRPHE